MAFHGLFLRRHDRQEERKNQAQSRQASFVPRTCWVAADHRLAIHGADQQGHDDVFEGKHLARQQFR